MGDVAQVWTLPVISFAVYALLYAAADLISKKTKGMISSILFLSIVYLFGFLSGIFPSDAISATGITSLLAAFGMLCTVTNLGTLINLQQFAREWKTVAICLGGIVTLSLFGLYAGYFFFDQLYGLCSIPAISGGIVALAIMSDALKACEGQFVAFTMLCFAIHSFIGLPAASYMLRKFCLTDPSGAAFLRPAEDRNGASSLRVFHFRENSKFLFARLGIVMAAASILARLTGDIVPAAILGLVLGVFGAETGFLENNTLQKCGCYELMMFFMISSAIDPLSRVDTESLIQCLPPLAFYMLGGCAATMLGGILMGRILHVDRRLACALSCGCMIGFPGTLIAAQDVVDSMGFPEETRAEVRETLGIKMVIAGFATVSTSSIVIASMIAPILSG